MKKTFLKHGLLVGVMAVSVLTVVPLTAGAETADSTTNQATRETAQKEIEARREAAKAKLEAQREEARAKHEAQREATKTRLADAKLQACEKRQTVISNIMKRISDRGQKQIDLFSGIAARTQAFYEKKGKTLSNYDALVADVAAKKESAQDAVAMIAAHGTEFDCNSEDPKGSVTSFREHQKQAIAALKEYKTSVKNLIVGVKSVQGVTSSEGERN
jgi:uncharacterized membrane protein YqiK